MIKDYTVRGWFHKAKFIVWERDNWTCQYCGLYMKPLYDEWRAGRISRTRAMITIDHIIPKQEGQKKDYSLENMTTACKPCNNKKGGRDEQKKRLQEILKEYGNNPRKK